MIAKPTLPSFLRAFVLAPVLEVLLAPVARSEEFELPWASPAASVTQTIGITDVTIHYHRPQSKGRDLAKDLAALAQAKQVWRMGANEATRLVVSDPILFGGEEIPAGEYGLFALPAADEWTLIVSKQAKNWGAYGYDPKLDVARVYVTPQQVEENVEWLTFSIDPVTNESAVLRFAWSSIRLEVPIEVDVEAVVAQRIEQKLAVLDAKDWDTRLAIAKYWCERNENLERAESLIDEALTIQRHFWTCEWKAKILDRRGRRAEAIPLLEEAIRLAEGRAPKEYGANLERLVLEWKAK
jgi:tetratricopeptide (TPR) repeat protein